MRARRARRRAPRWCSATASAAPPRRGGGGGARRCSSSATASARCSSRGTRTCRCCGGWCSCSRSGPSLLGDRPALLGRGGRRLALRPDPRALPRAVPRAGRAGRACVLVLDGRRRPEERGPDAALGAWPPSALGAVLWAAADHRPAHGGPGQLRRCSSTTSRRRPRSRSGCAAAGTEVLEHFDLGHLVVDQVREPGLLARGELGRFPVGLAAAPCCSWRGRSPPRSRGAASPRGAAGAARRRRRRHVLGWYSISRVFGVVWYYLMLWLWAVARCSPSSPLVWSLVVLCRAARRAGDAGPARRCARRRWPSRCVLVALLSRPRRRHGARRRAVRRPALAWCCRRWPARPPPRSRRARATATGRRRPLRRRLRRRPPHRLAGLRAGDRARAGRVRRRDGARRSACPSPTTAPCGPTRRPPASSSSPACTSTTGGAIPGAVEVGPVRPAHARASWPSWPSCGPRWRPQLEAEGLAELDPVPRHQPVPGRHRPAGVGAAPREDGPDAQDRPADVGVHHPARRRRVRERRWPPGSGGALPELLARHPARRRRRSGPCRATGTRSATTPSSPCGRATCSPSTTRCSARGPRRRSPSARTINNPGPLLFDVLAGPAKVDAGRRHRAGRASPCTSAAVVARRACGPAGSRARRARGRSAPRSSASSGRWAARSSSSPGSPTACSCPSSPSSCWCGRWRRRRRRAARGRPALASLILQTHLSYAVLVPVLAVRRRRGPGRAGRAGRRRPRRAWAHLRRPLLVAVVVLAVAWSQPWSTRSPGEGNLGKVVSNGAGDGEVAGPRFAASVLASVGAVPGGWGPGGFEGLQVDLDAPRGPRAAAAAGRAHRPRRRGALGARGGRAWPGWPRGAAWRERIAPVGERRSRWRRSACGRRSSPWRCSRQRGLRHRRPPDPAGVAGGAVHHRGGGRRSCLRHAPAAGVGRCRCSRSCSPCSPCPPTTRAPVRRPTAGPSRSSRDLVAQMDEIDGVGPRATST